MRRASTALATSLAALLFAGCATVDRVADAPPFGGPAGAVVRQVLPDTPAGPVGLRPGDVIVSVDGIPVNSAADLSNIMDQRRPGNTLMLTWIDRTGNPRVMPVLLAKGPVG